MQRNPLLNSKICYSAYFVGLLCSQQLILPIENHSLTSMTLVANCIYYHMKQRNVHVALFVILKNREWINHRYPPEYSIYQSNLNIPFTFLDYLIQHYLANNDFQESEQLYTYIEKLQTLGACISPNAFLNIFKSEYMTNKIALEKISKIVRLGFLDEQKRGLIHFAAATKNAAICKLILAFDNNVNLRDKHNNTPLHIALLSNYYPVCTELIARGANPDLPNIDNVTPYKLAFKIKFICPKIRKLLLETVKKISFQERKICFEENMDIEAIRLPFF